MRIIPLYFLFISSYYSLDLTKTSHNNRKIFLIIQEYLAYPERLSLSPQYITFKNPFLFIEQRETKSSIRLLLMNYSHVDQNMTRHIPCYTCHCESTSIINEKNKLSLLSAGYFNWLESDHYRRHNDSLLHSNRSFSCATILRNPSSRIQLCLKNRMKNYLQSNRYKCLNDINLNDFTDLLLKGNDIYGFSCLNEPFRMLSGFGDESELHGLSLTYNSSFSIFTFHQTLKHLLKCTPGETFMRLFYFFLITSIGVVEFPESFVLLQHRFPQLSSIFSSISLLYNQSNPLFTGNFSDHTAFQDSSKCPPLDVDHQRIIKKYSLLEQYLYEAVVEKTLRRLKRLPEILELIRRGDRDRTEKEITFGVGAGAGPGSNGKRKGPGSGK